MAHPPVCLPLWSLLITVVGGTQDLRCRAPLIPPLLPSATLQDDNWEQDDGPKSWLVDSLPTSDEVKQQLKEFDYKGNLVRK